MLMHHLEETKFDGVHYFLVNKLYTSSISHVDFYMPELW